MVCRKFDGPRVEAREKCFGKGYLGHIGEFAGPVGWEGVGRVEGWYFCLVVGRHLMLSERHKPNEERQRCATILLSASVVVAGTSIPIEPRG